LITLAIVAAATGIDVALRSLDDKLARFFGMAFCLGFAIWASHDADQIKNIDYYKTNFPVRYTGRFMFFLWPVAFPWYLVVRSKIKAGVMPRIEQGEPRPRASALKVALWTCGILVVIAFVSAALFMSASKSVDNIWQEASSRLANSAKQSPVADSSLTTSPGASTPTPSVATLPVQATLMSYVGHEPDEAFFKQDKIQAALQRVFSADEMGQFADDQLRYSEFEKCELEDGHIFVFEWTGKVSTGIDGNIVAVDLESGGVILVRQGDEPGIVIKGDLSACDSSKLPKLMQTWIKDMRSRAATDRHIPVEQVSTQCDAGIPAR
jgi:hypothetical protein